MNRADIIKTQTDKRKSLLTELTAARIACVKAISEAGYQVESRPSSSGQRFMLIITHETLPEKYFQRLIELKLDARSTWSSDFENVVTYKTTGYRNGRPHRFSKLDAKLPGKLIQLLKEDLSLAMERRANDVTCKNIENYWNERRSKELKGVVVPPNCEINVIVAQDHKAAPTRYTVDFGDMKHLAMTAAQVCKLTEVLNEIAGTKELVCIIGSRNKVEGNEEVATFYGHNYWQSFGNKHTPLVAYTKEHAESIMKEIKDEAQIIPYTKLAVIR